MSGPGAVVCIVAAMARNGVIGRDGGLPWRLPEDLKHFRRITLGKPLVMGRKTFDSIGRPLPGRTSLVVTRNANWRPPGAEVCPDPDRALARAREVAARDGVAEICVIGGGQIYAQTLAHADRLYLTEVALDVPGDTRFPVLNRAEWRTVERRDGDVCRFVTLARMS